MLPGAFCSSKHGGKRSSRSSLKSSTREGHSAAARESQEAIAAAKAGVTPEDVVGLYHVARKLRLLLFTEVSMSVYHTLLLLYIGWLASKKGHALHGDWR